MTKIEFWILGLLIGIGLYAVLRLPGAGVAITVFLSAMGFMLAYKGIQSKKWPEILVGIGYSFSFAGALFKLMHWPFAGALLLLGAIAIFGFVAIAIQLLQQKIYGSHKFSLLMIFLGLTINLIHSALSFFHVLPSHLLENIRLTFPVLIIFPTLLLLFTRPWLFKDQNFYPLLLLISSFHLVSSAIWVGRLLDGMV